MHEDVRSSPAAGAQAEFPFAIVQGEPLTALPRDLYIPPDALEIILEAFEGPLDLLLYLIRRQNLDILDIPIAEITRQYMGYIELMQELRLDLAGEYLVMAATLAEIKSRMLVPRQAPEGETEEEDPRAELVRRLQEYERFKRAAEDLDTLPRQGRDRFSVSLRFAGRRVVRLAPEVSFDALLASFGNVMRQAALFAGHRVALEPVSVRQRMSELVSRLRRGVHAAFTTLLESGEGRDGVIVSFLAVLELVRTGFAAVTQAALYGPLYIEAVGLSDGEGTGSDGGAPAEETLES